MTRRFIHTATLALILSGGITVPVIAQDGSSPDAVDTIDASHYFVIAEDSTTEWHYSMVGDSVIRFTDRFVGTRNVGGKRYAQRVRRYSTGYSDTTLYRQDDQAFYHLNPANGNTEESITLPKELYVGRQWTEWNGSWLYEVVSTSGQIKQFDSLLVVRASKAPKTMDEKPASMDLYWSKDRGMIAVKSGDQLKVVLTSMTFAPDL
jgi:hypothetical protein